MNGITFSEKASFLQCFKPCQEVPEKATKQCRDVIKPVYLEFFKTGVSDLLADGTAETHRPRLPDQGEAAKPVATKAAPSMMAWQRVQNCNQILPLKIPVPACSLGSVRFADGDFDKASDLLQKDLGRQDGQSKGSKVHTHKKRKF